MEITDRVQTYLDAAERYLHKREFDHAHLAGRLATAASDPDVHPGYLEAALEALRTEHFPGSNTETVQLYIRMAYAYANAQRVARDDGYR